jgi:hypothetical protein
MFVKQVFQLVKPFLAILHYTIFEKYSYVLHDPKFLFISFLTHEYKKTQNFTRISNMWK